MRYVPLLASLIGIAAILLGVYGLAGAWWTLVAAGITLLLVAAAVANELPPPGEEGA